MLLNRAIQDDTFGADVDPNLQLQQQQKQATAPAGNELAPIPPPPPLPAPRTMTQTPAADTPVLKAAPGVSGTGDGITPIAGETPILNAAKPEASGTRRRVHAGRRRHAGPEVTAQQPRRIEVHADDGGHGREYAPHERAEDLAVRGAAAAAAPAATGRTHAWRTRLAIVPASVASGARRERLWVQPVRSWRAGITIVPASVAGGVEPRCDHR
jgi:hypothetical protein